MFLPVSTSSKTSTLLIVFAGAETNRVPHRATVQPTMLNSVCEHSQVFTEQLKTAALVVKLNPHALYITLIIASPFRIFIDGHFLNRCSLIARQRREIDISV